MACKEESVLLKVSVNLSGKVFKRALEHVKTNELLKM